MRSNAGMANRQGDVELQTGVRCFRFRTSFLHDTKLLRRHKPKLWLGQLYEAMKRVLTPFLTHTSYW